MQKMMIIMHPSERGMMELGEEPLEYNWHRIKVSIHIVHRTSLPLRKGGSAPCRGGVWGWHMQILQPKRLGFNQARLLGTWHRCLLSLLFMQRDRILI